MSETVLYSFTNDLILLDRHSSTMRLHQIYRLRLGLVVMHLQRKYICFACLNQDSSRHKPWYYNNPINEV